MTKQIDPASPIPVVEDVMRQFSHLPRTGHHHVLKGLPYYADIGIGHVQGVAESDNGDVTLIAHSTANGQGRLIAHTRSTSSVIEVATPDGWTHPGGIHTAGDYVFVPCEKDGKSRLLLYQLAGISEGRLDLVAEHYFDHEAGAVGITTTNVDGANYCLLLIGDQNRHHAYLSPPNSMENLTFEPVGHFDLVIAGASIQCQGFGLVTDETAYMIALHSTSKGATYQDRAHLVQLRVEQGQITPYFTGMTKHLRTSGHIRGIDAAHFRWGAGISINDGQLTVLASARNITSQRGNRLAITKWLAI